MVEPVENVMIGVWLAVCCMCCAWSWMTSVEPPGSGSGRCSPVVCVSSRAMLMVLLMRCWKSGLLDVAVEGGEVESDEGSVA